MRRMFRIQFSVEVRAGSINEVWKIVDDFKALLSKKLETIGGAVVGIDARQIADPSVPAREIRG
jgi:hypothetical protein